MKCGTAGFPSASFVLRLITKSGSALWNSRVAGNALMAEIVPPNLGHTRGGLEVFDFTNDDVSFDRRLHG